MNDIDITKLKKNYKIAITLISDFLMVVFISLPIAYLIYQGRFNVSIYDFVTIITISSFISLFFLLSTGFYKHSIRSYESRLTILRVMSASAVFGFLNSFQIYSNFGVDFFYVFIISALGFFSTINLARDIAGSVLNRYQKKETAENIIIYGAGEAGKQLYRTIETDNNINVIGFYDNSKTIQNSQIFNKNVYGKFNELLKLKEKYKDLQVYLAIPSITSTKRESIITKMEDHKIVVKSVPGYHQILSEEKIMLEIEDLTLDDIIPREVVDRSDIDFKLRNVLITGAGGSIGSEIVKQILVGHAKKIILYEISEFNLYKIKSEADSIKKNLKLNTEIIPVLGDVKDRARLKSMLQKYNINYLYHAAAYKHVPIVEDANNIIEGIKNNVFGTKIVCEVSIECKVEKLVVISTDKAVRPTNYMGASKRLAELIAQSLNDKSNQTKICMVRFGNVMNSSGSVIPLFRKQINEGGPITITDKKVTRFFMTISEASSLVLAAGEFCEGGEVFLLNMGKQIKIYDLAKRLVHLSGRNVSYTNDSTDGINIIEIGLRPGEKLYEELLISGEEKPTKNKKIFMSNENYLAYDELIIILDKLKDSCKNNDNKAVNKILKETVEGF